MAKEKIYLGAKTSIYYTPLNHHEETGFSTAAGNLLISGDNSINTTIKPNYNFDLVLGYELTPSLLTFIESGVTLANVEQDTVMKRTRTNISTLSNVI